MAAVFTECVVIVFVFQCFAQFVRDARRRRVIDECAVYPIFHQFRHTTAVHGNHGYSQRVRFQNRKGTVFIADGWEQEQFGIPHQRGELVSGQKACKFEIGDPIEQVCIGTVPCDDKGILGQEFCRACKIFNAFFFGEPSDIDDIGVGRLRGMGKGFFIDEVMNGQSLFAVIFFR